MLNSQFPVTMLSSIKTIRISSDITNYNLAVALGNPIRPVDVKVVIATGVYVYSTDTSIPAFNTGNLPSGSKLVIENHGYIMGMGGRGGWRETSTNFRINGENGGPALNLTLSTTIDNTSGWIGGGGGGGSYGGTGGGGGAGGGDGGTGLVIGDNGIGGMPRFPGTNGKFTLSTTNGSGAGGGRIVPGVGGAGGISDGRIVLTVAQGGGAGGGGGGTGGSNTGSSGGTGGSGNASGGSTISHTPGGGGGGGYGAPGGNTEGNGTPNDGLGGLGGKAINLNGHIITFTGGNIPSRVMGVVS